MTLQFSPKVVFGATVGPSISQTNRIMTTQNPSQKRCSKKLPKMFRHSPSKLEKVVLGAGETLVFSFPAMLQYNWKSVRKQSLYGTLWPPNRQKKHSPRLLQKPTKKTQRTKKRVCLKMVSFPASIFECFSIFSHF